MTITSLQFVVELNFVDLNPDAVVDTDDLVLLIAKALEERRLCGEYTEALVYGGRTRVKSVNVTYETQHINP